MNENVIEIISELIKKLLNDEALGDDEKDLIDHLLKKGYNLSDINQAFEMIFSSEKIEKAIKGEESFNTDPDFKQRVFDQREKFYFSLRVQGIITKLNTFGLIKQRELEIIIAKSLSKKDKVSPQLFWGLIQDMIDDELRLVDISNKIEEFKLSDNGVNEYLN